MVEKTLKSIQLEVAHHDCVGCQLTEKYSNTSIDLMSGVSLIHKCGKLVGYQGIFEVSSEDKKEHAQFIDSLKKSKRIRELRVLETKPKTSVVYANIIGKSSSYETIMGNNAFSIDTVKMQRGYDVHKFATTDFKEVKKILNELEEIGGVKVKKIETLGKTGKKEKLTKKQSLALETAISHKYYSWPRKVTLDDLAKKINSSRRAYQENLRKAESKVFPELINDYLSVSSPL